MLLGRDGGSLALTVVAGGAGGLPPLTGSGSREPKVVLDSGPEMFVVITAVAGGASHPPVSVTGAGLDAVVTVGGQTVRFDGKRIVFAR